MKKYCVIQWIGSCKYYVNKTYANRVICREATCGAIRFETEEKAKKYLAKLQQIDPYGEFQIRQFA